MTIFLKRYDFEMDGKFGTLILELSINYESQYRYCHLLTRYSARHVGALEKLPNGLHWWQNLQPV